MKMKKFLALSTASVMALSMAACGSTDNGGAAESSVASTTPATAEASSEAAAPAEVTSLNYAELTLGEDYTDITTTIKVLTNRTDLLEDGAAVPFQTYIDAFNEMYPNITVDIEGITDYASDTLLRLQGGDWGDVMFIPAVDKADLSTYFLPLGTTTEMDGQLNYYNQMYEGTVYGVPYTAGVSGGIVYNKAVFEAAGITEMPKTPEDFIAALKQIKEYDSSIIPLYTNYAAGWAMGGQWDPAISGSATGDSTYMNQKLLHTANPFADPGDGTGAYNVYKVMYDAVAEGLTEEDYSTTDWEGCKGMINNGQIACMVLGSWAVVQMQEAGDNADDIGYMPFPITVDGKQYASAGPDYCYGINVHSDYDNQLASMIYVKWLTEESNFSYDQGGIPICVGDEYPEVLAAFDGVELVVDNPAPEGEEDLFGEINTESEIALNNDNTHVQNIVEHALSGDMTMEEIVDEWNQAWTDAQEEYDVTPAPYVYGSGVVAE